MNRTFEKQVVMCVDDEPAILSALERTLRLEPYEVITTNSPERALKWAETRDISLIITDQRMPRMQGTELLLELSNRSPAMARIILTAYPERTMNTPGLRRWTECVISKPWDNTMLRKTIRQLLLDRELDLTQEEEALRP
jgi:response regulator RpfG family c-di-GMP phosphodiesterase